MAINNIYIYRPRKSIYNQRYLLPFVQLPVFINRIRYCNAREHRFNGATHPKKVVTKIYNKSKEMGKK